MRASIALIAAATACAVTRQAAAQSTTGDSLRLEVLHAAAEQRDPRLQQLALRETQTALRLRTIAAERLPTVAGTTPTTRTWSSPNR